MLSFDRNVISALFIATWVLFILVALAVHWRATTPTKIRFHRYFPIAVGLAFLGFVTALEGVRSLYFLLPAVVLIVWLNIKTVKFCPACGRLNRSPFGFPVPRHCYSCGTAIPPTDPHTHLKHS